MQPGCRRGYKMSLIVIIGIIAASLFMATYFTRRRFGVLGLALCAGSILSGLWVDDVTPLVREAGVQLLSPPLASVVGVCLVLLPAVIMLFSGATYNKKFPRIVGSLAFALLAAALLLTPLGTGLVLDSTGKQAYDFLVENRNLIITAAIIYALFDLLTIKTPKKKEE